MIVAWAMLADGTLREEEKMDRRARHAAPVQVTAPSIKAGGWYHFTEVTRRDLGGMLEPSMWYKEKQQHDHDSDLSNLR